MAGPELTLVARSELGLRLGLGLVASLDLGMGMGRVARLDLGLGLLQGSEKPGGVLERVG